MSKRLTIASGLAAVLCACSSAEKPALQSSDAHIAAVFNAPGGVVCIQLIASSANRTASKTFTVTAGQSTVSLSMTGIPTGKVLFSGQAFNIPCANVFTGAVPAWIADDVTAIVNASGPATVQLTFRGNGSANVGGNFVGDDYATTTLAGSGVQGHADLNGGAALFEGPNSLALSADGSTLYVGDRNFAPAPGGTIGMTTRAVNPVTGQVTTLAGSPTASGTADGPGASARFVRLFSLALSGSDLLIADRCAIRKMSTFPPFNVTTLIGTRRANNANLWDCTQPTSTMGQNDFDIAARGST